MRTVYTIIHTIPGRIRLHIPLIAGQKEVSNVEKAFESIRGIELVTVQPITNSMMIKYDKNILTHLDVIRFVQLFFGAEESVAQKVPQQDMKKDIQHSVLSGALLLASYYRKNNAASANLLDYIMAVTTSYTVSARSENKLAKPEIIKALVSVFSSGTGGVLQSALVAYLLNIVQMIGSVRKQPQLSYARM